MWLAHCLSPTPFWQPGAFARLSRHRDAVHSHTRFLPFPRPFPPVLLPQYPHPFRNGPDSRPGAPPSSPSARPSRLSLRPSLASQARNRLWLRLAATSLPDPTSFSRTRRVPDRCAGGLRARAPASPLRALSWLHRVEHRAHRARARAEIRRRRGSARPGRERAVRRRSRRELRRPTRARGAPANSHWQHQRSDTTHRVARDCDSAPDPRHGPDSSTTRTDARGQARCPPKRRSGGKTPSLGGQERTEQGRAGQGRAEGAAGSREKKGTGWGKEDDEKAVLKIGFSLFRFPPLFQQPAPRTPSISTQHSFQARMRKGVPTPPFFRSLFFRSCISPPLGCHPAFCLDPPPARLAVA